MKKNILLLFCFILISLDNYAQATSVLIYTPKGHSLIAWETIETVSDEYKLSISNQIALHFPNAEELNAPSSTSTYNCHGYAWHMSEGGSTVWIGLNNYDSNPHEVEDVYWEKGSYKAASESMASSNKGKVSYYQGNHSGIYAGDGDVISKWGPGPLMKHAPGYGPDGRADLGDYNMEYRNSYVIDPEITGSQAILCDNVQRTFTEESITHLNVGYNWAPSYELSYVSGQGTENYTVKGKEWSHDYGKVMLTVTTPSGSTGTSESDEFWVGRPNPEGVGIEGGYLTYPSPFPCIYYYETPYGVHREGHMEAADMYSWDGMVLGNITSTYSGAYFHPVPEGPPHYGSGYILLSGINSCGSSTIGTGYGSCGYMMVVMPNPATDEATLSIESSSTEKTLDDEAIEWEFEVFTDRQMLKQKETRIQSKTATLRTAGWKDGVYIIRAVYNGEVIHAKLVVKH